jgi:hypothetical protein
MDSRSSCGAPASHPDRGTRPEVQLRDRYRRIHIVDGRKRFTSAREAYDPATDLVLTYDFGLKREIERLGGDVAYVDHLVDADTMQANNFRLYRFFERWHLDSSGEDIFTHDGVPFGFSFRLEFWNDFVFHARTWLCVERIVGLVHESLFVGTAVGEVEKVLRAMNVAFTPLDGSVGTSDSYFFPIHEWMEANIRRRGVKALILDTLTWAIARVYVIRDTLSRHRYRRPSIFVQEYYPTANVISRLRSGGRVRVVGPVPTRAHLFGRFVPLPFGARRRAVAAQAMLSAFRSRRCERLVLQSGTDIAASVYSLIEARISGRVAESIRVIDGARRYLSRDPFRLVLLISNIGEIITLVNCVCSAGGIPSYLIINGLLAAEYGDDSKHATVINAYSESIRDNYFRGMENVVCLGDPRMDAYPPVARRDFTPADFTITIGASGFNPTDLNSFVAVEFEFIHGVLQAISRVRDASGASIRVTIKVRANGSRSQYVRFTAEYFPELGCTIVDDAPIRSVLEETDLFVSIYSQTLFEASCMGIPVVYFRVGDVFKYPPFDGRSELVTVDSVSALAQAIEDFRNRHERFDAFLNRSVMERYIGPLDGNNLERNVALIYQMLDQPAASEAR